MTTISKVNEVNFSYPSNSQCKWKRKLTLKMIAVMTQMWVWLIIVLVPWLRLLFLIKTSFIKKLRPTKKIISYHDRRDNRSDFQIWAKWTKILTMIKGELTSFSIMNMVKVLEKCGRTKKKRTLKAAFLRFWRIF